jgi:CelD/BcsL family acetyltransferase involved in cellulose biosynthesis
MSVKASADRTIVTRDSTASAIASARRAVLADRYPANAFMVERKPLSQLAPIAEAWRDLAAGALEPNVFYEPSFALPAAQIFGRDAGAVLVWSGTEPRRLLGFFPARIQRRRYGVKLPVLTGFTHSYGPLGVPLVEREAAEPIVAAWLAYLAADADLPGLMLMPYLTANGPFATVLETILRRAQMPSADFNRHERALLAPAGERDLYVERSLGQRQHKELRRHWRRLGETGAVLFSSATEPDAITAALADFFALEAAGWKGRAGTAMTGRADIRHFIETAVSGLAAEGLVAIDRIRLDGRAVAATIVLRSGRTVWFWKIAYDEAFSKVSPGVMLSVVLTDELLEDPTVARADSCATAGHPMIDHLWRERLPLADRLIAIRPQAPFALARNLETLRVASIAGARRVRGGIRS